MFSASPSAQVLKGGVQGSLLGTYREERIKWHRPPPRGPAPRRLHPFREAPPPPEGTAPLRKAPPPPEYTAPPPEGASPGLPEAALLAVGALLNLQMPGTSSPAVAPAGHDSSMAGAELRAALEQRLDALAIRTEVVEHPEVRRSRRDSQDRAGGRCCGVFRAGPQKRPF